MNQLQETLQEAQTNSKIAKAAVDLDVRNLRLLLSQDELDLQTLGALAQVGESLRHDFDEYFDCILKERQAESVAKYFQ